MRIIDLSQAHCNRMTQFPGTPDVNIEQVCEISQNGFRLTDFHAVVHTGTHCDAPAHYVEGAETIDQMALERFIGEAIIVDITTKNGRELPASILDGKIIKKGDILVLRSGFSKKWDQIAYVEDYPFLSIALAERIISLGVKAVAIDFLSPDPIDGDSVHKILLKAGIFPIENLANLDKIPNERFFLSAAPVLIKDAEGAFTRAYGIVE